MSVSTYRRFGVFPKMSEEIGERREKIESKGAYSYDLHKGIRTVYDAFDEDNLDRVGRCLDALLDICAPEIREAVTGEWNKIDKKYRPMLEKINNAKFVLEAGRSGFETDYRGNTVYYVNIDAHVLPSQEKRLAENARHNLLRQVWSKIYHERLQACIDCLDRHGELRKWREVEYGKL